LVFCKPPIPGWPSFPEIGEVFCYYFVEHIFCVFSLYLFFIFYTHDSYICLLRLSQRFYVFYSCFLCIFFVFEWLNSSVLSRIPDTLIFNLVHSISKAFNWVFIWAIELFISSIVESRFWKAYENWT
jgi:hypothetical protein